MTSVDIVIPVYNEERDLPRSVATLGQFLRDNLSGRTWRIVIADNGSTDGTLAIAQALSARLPGVTCIHLPEKGRGRALRRAWLESNADIVSYMDVDLSTDLKAFPALVQAIEQGADIAVGSRLMRGAKVLRRPLKREITSRGYNILIKLLFWTRFSDAQCGFKALSRRAAQAILPVTKDLAWFLDSEILIIAEKNGLRIADVPVTWVDDPDSRVKVMKTAWGDIKGLLRLRFGGIPRVAPPAAKK